MTIMPISSHALTSSGAGMLWEVRMALTPISFIMRTCRRIAASLTAAPKGPRSWWLHTPLNCVLLPLRKNPLPGMTSRVRMPNRVVYS